ncbi:MAG: NAD(P)-dependent oxidoreductase [bacterium]|nr:NAD(P)-dependent oxidoreductase [bacterium]
MYKKIVVLDSVIFYPEHKERLDKIAQEVVEYNTCYNEKEIVERVKGADCIISCWVNIPNRIIDENSQLKTIAFWTHAYEHRIDKGYALKHNIFMPSIPDYGTDSVAELTFIGLLQIYRNQYYQDSLLNAGSDSKNTNTNLLQEEIIAKISNNVRNFNKNCKDNLKGSWFHEYVKNGKLKIVSPDAFKEETLKGLTVGFLINNNYQENLYEIITQGFRMNAIYSLIDLPHAINLAYRPIDNLLKESHVIVYDSRIINKKMQDIINKGGYLSIVDIAKITPSGHSLMKKKIGIVGLGRIGKRVAQIAKDAFNMDISYFSRTRNFDMEKKYNIQFKTLNQILTNSEIITFHLPHIGAEKFITNKMIDLIPKGTTVINVSVGSIFENQAYFLSRFSKDDLNGYVDVYETLPPREELRKRKDYLISTYRLGWRTKSTIGLKTHKLITRLEEGLNQRCRRILL